MSIVYVFVWDLVISIDMTGIQNLVFWKPEDVVEAA